MASLGKSNTGIDGAVSLRRRVQLSSVFSLGGFGASQVLRLISNLILTRLLFPESFGLMAVAASINVWAVMLTDIGISSSVIQNRNSDDHDFLHTAWTIQVCRNILIWLLVLVAALAIFLLNDAGVFRDGSMFTHASLPWVMVLTSGQLLIGGFTSLNYVIAQRKLAVGRLMMLEVGSQLFAMAATISLAFLGWGVWALVTGMLIGVLIKTVASYIIFDGPAMRWRFEKKYALEILHFGKWLIISSFFGFFANRGDQILFGGLMNSNDFGLYAVAAIWVAAAAVLMETIIGRVFFPAFSEILRDRPQNLAKAYNKTRMILDAAAACMAIGAFFLSEFAFSIIYPENYSGVGYYIKLMSPFLLLIPFRLINMIVLATGDSRNFASISTVAGISALIIVPGVFHMFGERAAVVSFAVIELVALPLTWREGSKHMKLNLLTEGRLLFVLGVLMLLIFMME